MSKEGNGVAEVYHKDVQGRYEPKIDAIERISRAPGVSTGTLYDPGVMSFDNPLDFETTWIRNGGDPHMTNANGRKALMIVRFEDLNDVGQRHALELLEMLSKVPEYQVARPQEVTLSIDELK